MKKFVDSLLLFLLWTPRILLILSSAFLIIFSWKLLLAGISILALSWKWPWIGGVICTGAGIAYIIDKWGSLDHLVYISLLFIGALFLLGWFLRKKITRAQDAYWENT